MGLLTKEIFLLRFPQISPAAKDIYLLRKTSELEREKHIDGGLILSEEESFSATHEYCSLYSIPIHNKFLRDCLELKNFYDSLKGNRILQTLESLSPICQNFLKVPTKNYYKISFID